MSFYRSFFISLLSFGRHEKFFALLDFRKENQLSFVLLANFGHNKLLKKIGFVYRHFVAFAYKSHPGSRGFWKEELSKAPLRSKNDRKKKIWVHSVFILVLLHIPVKGHKKSLFLFAIVFLLLSTVIVNGKGKVRLGLLLFCCFQKKRKTRRKKGKKAKRKKKLVMFGSVLFTADHGQGRRHGKSSAWSTAILWFLALLQVAIMRLKK